MEQSIKDINRNNIYRYIWNNKCVSKREIEKNLNLSLPTITSNLSQLTKEGLVKKNGMIKNTGGRNASGYSIVPDVKMAVGVDISRTHISAVAVDLYGKILSQYHLHCKYNNSDEYMKKIGEVTDRVIKELNITEEVLLGVGMSVQGLVSEDRKEVVYGKVLDNDGISVDTYSKYVPYDCELFHDSESAAFAEQWISPDNGDAVYVSFGTNLGGAIIVDNNIYRGKDLIAGKLEHMTIHPKGLKCYCGMKGCAEAYCNISYLTEGVCTDRFDKFFELLGSKNKKAQKKWKEFVENAALLINNIHMLLDCDIIIGGYLAHYIGDYIEELKSLAYDKKIDMPERDYIRVGEFREEPIATGAALRYVDDFINSI